MGQRIKRGRAPRIQDSVRLKKVRYARGAADEPLSASECPHKLPFIAALLGLLANTPFTPPPSRIAAKPIVTMTGSEAGLIHLHKGERNGLDVEMQAPAPITPAPAPDMNIGIEIVKDLVKAFQNHLDARRWRSVRFSVSIQEI